MNIAIFNRVCWIRRFGVQRNVKGYLVSSHEDFAVSIHVHPSGTDGMQRLPEGQRRLKRLQCHSTAELLVADESENRKGDLLWYSGHWYECVNAQEWDHTILCHWNYDFVQVPEDVSGTIDLDPPEGDPVLTEAEDTEDAEESEDAEETG